MASDLGIAGRQTMSIGAVFSRALSALRGNPAAFLGIPFLLGALPSAVFAYIQGAAGLDVSRGVLLSGGTAAAVGLQLLGGVLALFLSMLVQGALVQSMLDHVEGRRATIGESVRTGAAVALPLLGLAIVIGFGVMMGFLVLIVPGVILYIMWSVAAPALVAERLGVIEALGRSRRLTKGARWRIFGLSLVLLIVVSLLSSLIGVLIVTGHGLREMSLAAGNGLPFSWLIAQLLISTLLTAIWSTVQNALYVELRDWKDGLSPDNLTAVFA